MRTCKQDSVTFAACRRLCIREHGEWSGKAVHGHGIMLLHSCHRGAQHEYRAIGKRGLSKSNSAPVLCCAGTSEEDVWAGKSSVLVALQEAGPMRAQRPHAEHDAEDPMRGMQLGDDDEDPMLRMSSGKKAKKEKKEMKKKDRKEKKQVTVSASHCATIQNKAYFT